MALVALALALLVLSTPHRIWPDDNQQKPGVRRGSGAGGENARIAMPRYLQCGKHAPISLEDATGAKISSPFAWRVTQGKGLVLLSDPPAPQGAFKAGDPPPQPVWDLSALAAGDVTVVATDPATTMTGGTDTGGIISDPGVIKIVSIVIAPVGAVTEGQPATYSITVSPPDLPIAYDDWTLTASTGQVFATGHLAAADFVLAADGLSTSAAFTATLPLGTAGRSDVFIHSTLALNDPVAGLTFMDTNSELLTILPATVTLTMSMSATPAVATAGSPILFTARGSSPNPSDVSVSYLITGQGEAPLASGLASAPQVDGSTWSSIFTWTPPPSTMWRTAVVSATATDGTGTARSTLTIAIAPSAAPTTLAFVSPPTSIVAGTPIAFEFSLAPDTVLPDVMGLRYGADIPSTGYFTGGFIDPRMLVAQSGALRGTIALTIPPTAVTAPLAARLKLVVDLFSQSSAATAVADFTVLPAATPPETPAITIQGQIPIVRREGLPIDVSFTLFPKALASTLTALTVSILDSETGAQIVHSNLDVGSWRATDDHALYSATFTVPDGVAAMSGGTGAGIFVIDAFDATGRIAQNKAPFTGLPRVTLTVKPSGDVLTEGVEEVLALTIQPPVEIPMVTLWISPDGSSTEPIAKWLVPSEALHSDFDPFGKPILVGVTRMTIPAGTVTADAPVTLFATALERGGRVIEREVEVHYILRPANVSRVPELLSASPASALPLAEIVLAGRNFRAIPDENTVTFTRGDQTVELYPLSTTADGTSLVVSVPPRIGEGVCEVRVRTADGESNAIPFTVLGSAEAVGGITSGIDAVLAIPGLKAPIKQALAEARKFVERFVALERAAEAAHGARDLQKQAATLGQALQHLAMSIRALAGKPEAETLLEVARQLVAARALLIGSPILEEETMAILEFLAQPGLKPQAATALLSALGGIDKAIDAYLLDWEVGVMDGILEMMYRLEDAEKCGVATKATRKKTTKKLIDKWTKIRNGYIQAGGAGIPMINLLGATLGSAKSTYDQCGSTKAVEGIKKDFIDKFYPPNPPTVPVTGPPGMPGMSKSKCEIFEDQVLPGARIEGVQHGAQAFIDPRCGPRIALQASGKDEDDWLIGCVGCLPAPKGQPWSIYELFYFRGCVQKKVVTISDSVHAEFEFVGPVVGALEMGANSAIWDPGHLEKGETKTATVKIIVKDGRGQESDWTKIHYTLTAKNVATPEEENRYDASPELGAVEPGSNAPATPIPGCGCNLTWGWETDPSMSGATAVTIPPYLCVNEPVIVAVSPGADADQLQVNCSGNGMCLPSSKKFAKEDPGIRFEWQADGGAFVGPAVGGSVVFVPDRIDDVSVTVTQKNETPQAIDPDRGPGRGTAVAFKFDLQVFKRGAPLPVSEEIEVTDGTRLMLNIDNDNNTFNGASDTPIEDRGETTVKNENDLTKVVVIVDPPKVRGVATLAAIVGAQKVKLWKHEEKRELAPPTFSDFPKTLWLEGVKHSAVLRDVWLELSFKAEGNPRECIDRATATVIWIDLDVDSDNSGGFDPVGQDPSAEDAMEGAKKLVGSVVGVNNDDDDEDFHDNRDGTFTGGPDNADSAVTGKPGQKALDKSDMARVRMALLPAGIETGTVTLRINRPDLVRVFGLLDAPKLGPIGGANVAETGVPLAGLFVGQEWRAEGLGTAATLGDGRELFELEYEDGQMRQKDEAVVTVVLVDADVDSNNKDGLEGSDFEDAQETRYPGMYVQVNDDDDDGNQQPDSANATIDGPIDEADLRPLLLRKFQPQAPPDVKGAIRLKVRSDSVGTIRVFDGAGTGASELLSPQKTESDDLWGRLAAGDVSLRIEGIDPGAVHLLLEYTKIAVAVSDEVAALNVRVRLKEVTFSGTKLFTISRDDGTAGAFGAPHWQDNSTPLDRDADDAPPGGTDRRVPVAFTRGSTMQATARIKIEPALAQGEKARVKGYGYRGDVYQGFNFGVQQTGAGVEVPVSGDEVVLTNAPCDIPLPKTVDIFDDTILASPRTPLTIRWQVSFDQGQSWLEPGSSKNGAYVTLGDPTTIVYHTAVHIGCKNGKGLDTETAVVDKIWTEFSDLATPVKRVFDGGPLSYYGAQATATGIFSTADLLRLGDGRCGAWGRFFNDCVRLQGIAGTTINEITLPPSPGLEPVLFVRNWNQANWAPLPGVAGQNNSDPPSRFTDHCVVSYGGKIYDPSYGAGPYASQQAWEDASLDGWGYRNPATGVTVPHVDIKGQLDTVMSTSTP